jgi:hypothetical protein
MTTIMMCDDNDHDAQVRDVRDVVRTFDYPEALLQVPQMFFGNQGPPPQRGSIRVV